MANNNYNKNSNSNGGRRISSPQDFRKINERLNYDIIDLYDWNETATQEYKLTVKVKRVGMKTILDSGIITNELMNEVANLPNANRKEDAKKAVQNFTPDMIQRSLETMRKMAAHILVEPTWEEVEEYITDTQVAQLIEYLNGGVKSLKNFRDEQKSIRGNQDSDNIPVPPIGADGDTR